MSLDDLEAPEFTEPVPGLSHEEDEEMFRARAQRLGRFVHSAVVQSRQTTTKALAPDGKERAIPTTTSARIPESNPRSRCPDVTLDTTQTGKDTGKVTRPAKPRKPRKPRDPSTTKPKKTKTTRRKRVPLDQVPDTVMPVLRAVSLTQQMELVGPEVGSCERNVDDSNSKALPHILNEMVKSRYGDMAMNPSDSEHNPPRSLLGLTRSIPSDLGLEEVYQLHEVIYQPRDFASDSDSSVIGDTSERGLQASTRLHYSDADNAYSSPDIAQSSDRRPMCEAPPTSVDIEDKSIEITNVKCLPEVICVGEDTLPEKPTESSTCEVNEMSSETCVLAAGSEQDFSFSPPPTFNYNNYKSFLTVAETNVVHVSDSECDIAQPQDKISICGDRPLGTHGEEGGQRIGQVSPGGAPLSRGNGTDSNDAIISTATPIRTNKFAGKFKRSNVDKYGAPIPRMINTQSGPTHIYRMYSSDSDDVDSWTPGKSSESQAEHHERRTKGSRSHPVALSSSPNMFGHSTPRAHKAHSIDPGNASSLEEALSSGDSSIISIRVGTGKPIHGSCQDPHASPTKSNAAPTIANSGILASREDVRSHSEIDLTGLSRDMDDSSSSEYFVPESPEANVDHIPSPTALQVAAGFLEPSNGETGVTDGAVVQPGDKSRRTLNDKPHEATSSFSGGASTGSRQKRSAPRKVTTHYLKKKRTDKNGTGDTMANAPLSTQVTASIAGQMIEKGEVDRMKMSELTEFVTSAPEARELWLKMLTYQPIPLSQLMEFNKDHGIKISKVLTIAWCDLHGVTWTSRDEEKEIAKEDSDC